MADLIEKDVIIEVLSEQIKDAERYRWARQQPMDTLLDLYVGTPDNAPEQLDAAIDAAMSNRVIETPPHD